MEESYAKDEWPQNLYKVMFIFLEGFTINLSWKGVYVTYYMADTNIVWEGIIYGMKIGNIRLVRS